MLELKATGCGNLKGEGFGPWNQLVQRPSDAGKNEESQPGGRNEEWVERWNVATASCDQACRPRCALSRVVFLVRDVTEGS